MAACYYDHSYISTCITLRARKKLHTVDLLAYLLKPVSGDVTCHVPTGETQ